MHWNIANHRCGWVHDSSWCPRPRSATNTWERHHIAKPPTMTPGSECERWSDKGACLHCVWRHSATAGFIPFSASHQMSICMQDTIMNVVVDVVLTEPTVVSVHASLTVRSKTNVPQWRNRLLTIGKRNAVWLPSTLQCLHPYTGFSKIMDWVRILKEVCFHIVNINTKCRFSCVFGVYTICWYAYLLTNTNF